MPKVEQISWCEVTGNKFSTSLKPAMLSDAGYVKLACLRKIGTEGKEMFNVHFDRAYALEFISRKLCRQFWCLGRQGVLDLVAEAWDAQYPKSIDL